MEAASKHKKVLVIDNDEDVLDVMNEARSYEGFKVNILTDTDNIFPDIKIYKPDIIILDYLLNGINGGDIYHQIKAIETTAQLPVIIISAHPKVLNSLGYYGCNAFIAKPFDIDQIIECVNDPILPKQSLHIC